MDLSVVIIHYKMKDILIRCLESVFSQSLPCQFEVILVNKESGDGTRQVVSKRFPQVRYIDHTRFGIAFSRNIGIKTSTGKYFLMLDADVAVQKGALNELVKFMDTHPEAGVAGGKLTYPDGIVQYSCRRYSSPLTMLLRRTSLKKVFPYSNSILANYLLSKWDHSEVREVDYVIGACFLMRRKAVEEIGLLDEHFIFGCEDEDWCYRARKAGWRVYYVPKAVFIHDYRQLSNKGLNRMTFEHFKSAIHYFGKRYFALRRS